jgi:hypothetical protein
MPPSWGCNVPFVLAIVGAILVIAAIRNTHGDLATALETDVPPYMVWAAALFGVGAIGWIPGMRGISRMLLALVVLVLVLANYKEILGGFTSLASAPAPTPAPATPAAQYASATGQATLPGPGGVTGQPSAASGGGLITASSPLSGHALPSLGSITGAAAGAVAPGAVANLVTQLLTI